MDLRGHCNRFFPAQDGSDRCRSLLNNLISSVIYLFPFCFSCWFAHRWVGNHTQLTRITWWPAYPAMGKEVN